jgi:hypothetical protein
MTIDNKGAQPHEYQKDFDALDDVTAVKLFKAWNGLAMSQIADPVSRRFQFESLRDAVIRARDNPEKAAVKAAAPMIPKIELTSLGAIAKEGIPALDWVLHRWVVRKDIVLFYGGGGIGKSTTAGAMAVALSQGKAWLGIEPDRAYRVLWIDEEQGLEEASRTLLRLGADDRLMFASGEEVRINSDEGAERLSALLADKKPEIVFIDSTAQAAVGVTNDPGDVTAVYSRLFTLRDRHDVVIVLIHHQNKSQTGTRNARGGPRLERAMGSQYWNTQASTAWFCEPGPDHSLNITQEKRRGASKANIVATYSTPEGEDGPIVIASGGEIEDTRSEISGCSEWIAQLIHDNGAMMKKAEIAAANAGLEKPYAERTLEDALTHGKDERTGFLTQPQYGYYDVRRTA